MPNNFGGNQDHPAYDCRRKLNPKTELLIGNTLYTLRGLKIESEDIYGAIDNFPITSSLLPQQVRDYFNQNNE